MGSNRFNRVYIRDLRVCAKERPPQTHPFQSSPFLSPHTQTHTLVYDPHLWNKSSHLLHIFGDNELQHCFFVLHFHFHPFSFCHRCCVKLPDCRLSTADVSGRSKWCGICDISPQGVSVTQARRSIIIMGWAAWQESKRVQQVKNTKAWMQNNKEDAAPPPVNDTHFSPHILSLTATSRVQFLLISWNLSCNFFLSPDDRSVSFLFEFHFPFFELQRVATFHVCLGFEVSICVPLWSFNTSSCIAVVFFICFVLGFFLPETVISTSCASTVWVIGSEDRPPPKSPGRYKHLFLLKKKEHFVKLGGFFLTVSGNTKTYSSFIQKILKNTISDNQNKKEEKGT